MVPLAKVNISISDLHQLVIPMFDYLQFPKLYTSYEIDQSIPLKDECMKLIEKYKASNNDLKLPSPFDLSPLEEFESELNDDINENSINVANIIAIIPKYYVTMELKRLGSMLNRVLLVNNYIEILCHLYISHLFQLWFSGDANLNKYLASNYKRITMMKAKHKSGNQELFDLVEIFTLFNDFRNLNFETTEVNVDAIKKLGFLQEYSYILVISQMLTRPFNEIDLDDDDILHILHDSPMLNLLKQCKEFTINFKNYDDLQLQPLHYLLPKAYNISFENYFKLILKFRCFLNLIKISSKISSLQVKRLLGDDNINKYILLISSLNLNAIGIGYNANGDYFYNDDKSCNLINNDIIKINELLESERISLIIKNELINRLTG